MELLSGSDLQVWVREHGKLASSEVLRIARQICQGLAYAHARGVVHRDLKPSNLFRLPDGSIKLLDFGLARDEDNTQMSLSGVGMGTLDYAAPEQRDDASKADARSDLYSLGATLYFLATGRSPRTVREQFVPAELREVVMRCLEEQPRERYPDVKALEQALRAVRERTVTPVAVDSTIECPSCMHQNGSSELYCVLCGNSLHLRCSDCTTPNPEVAKFCGKCGKSLVAQRECHRACLDAEAAIRDRRWTDAATAHERAVATKHPDVRLPKLERDVAKGLAERDAARGAALAAEQALDVAGMARALALLKQCLPPADAEVNDWGLRAAAVEEKLRAREGRFQRHVVAARSAMECRDWTAAVGLWELASQEKPDRMVTEAHKQCSGFIEECAKLRAEVTPCVNQLDHAGLQKILDRLGELLPADDKELAYWKNDTLVRLQIERLEAIRRYEADIECAMAAEARLDWKAGEVAWNKARGSVVAEPGAANGWTRCRKALESVRKQRDAADAAYGRADLPSLERAVEELSRLLAPANETLLMVQRQLLEPARTASEAAGAHARAAWELIKRAEFEECLRESDQALQLWKSHRGAKKLHARALDKLERWNKMLAVAEALLAAKNVRGLDVALEPCRRLRPLHARTKQLEAELVALKTKRRKRIGMLSALVFAGLIAWIWLAGLQYASRVAELERTCAEQLKEAERALKSAELANAETLLAQSGAANFDRGSALRSVEGLHAAGSLAWLPQPAFVAELALYGLEHPDLAVRASALRQSLKQRRNDYRAAVDQVHARLAAENFADAQIAIDALPSISKHESETSALLDLLDRLRRISTELVQLDSETSQRMGAADLFVAQRLHGDYEARRRAWVDAKPAGYRLEDPWPSKLSTRGDALAEMQQGYDEAVADFAQAASQLDMQRMQASSALILRYQKDDPEAVGRERLLSEAKLTHESAGDACDRVKERIASKDLEAAVGIVSSLSDAAARVFSRDCPAAARLQAAKTAYDAALAAFDTALQQANLADARQSLAAAQEWQRVSAELEARKRRLQLSETEAKSESEALARILSLIDARDLDAAQMAWVGLKSGQRQSAAARKVDTDLQARWKQFVACEQKLHLAVAALDETEAQDALRAMALIQASGPRLASARAEAENVFAEHRQSVAAALAQVETALQDKSEPQADVALSLLEGLLKRTPNGLNSENWTNAQAGVARLKKEKALASATARAREVLALPEPRLEDLESAARQLELLDGSSSLLPELRSKLKRASILKWAEVLVDTPDPIIVKDGGLRERLSATGLPWRVRDRATRIEMVLIPSGKFLRGGSDGGAGARGHETPTHEVTITKAFYMGVYEVTQGEWQYLMKVNPSRFTGHRKPVEQVSWYDTQEFLRKSNGLRLPTEGEWEYSCRAGTSTPLYGDLDAIAWYDGNSDGSTEVVGSKQANGFGLHDMLGNVWEWCLDRYGAYSLSAQTDPSGPISGEYRVCRGGSWNDDIRYCRAPYRNYNAPADGSFRLGYRVARNP
jgi:formylglycine-generating enzyme required for sulfatase activity